MAHTPFWPRSTQQIMIYVRNKPIQSLTLLIAVSLPSFALAIKGWTSGVLIISGILSLLLITLSPAVSLRNQAPLTVAEKWFLIAFFSPLLGTLFSATLRGDFHGAQFDSPVRFLLAAIVYLFIRGANRNIMHWLIISIPVGVFTAVVYQVIYFDYSAGLSSRAATHFMDSIMLGYISLALGMLSLYSAASGYIKNQPLLYISAIGGLAGIGLALLTKSRTGWIAVPFVFILFIFHLRKDKSLKPSRFLVSSIVTGSTLLIAVSFPMLQKRIGEAVQEISAYSFDGVASDASNSTRITYWRIGVELIRERPIQGYGDTSRTAPTFPEGALSYSSPTVQKEVFLVGFHNELIAATVRSGLPGGLSVLLVFLIPLGIFLKQIANPDSSKSVAAALGAGIVMIVFISSLTIETFGLKFATSLYALMVVLLLSQTLRANVNHADI